MFENSDIRMDRIKKQSFDVIIVGAGPAGCACAICLADSGLNIAVIDKEKFPREKVCGDGLTFDITNQLGWISKELSEDYAKLEKKLRINGVKIFSSENESIEFLFGDYLKNKQMYTCKRKVFDSFLFDQLKKYNNINVFENCSINKVFLNTDVIVAESENLSFEGKMIIGSDGQNSVISRSIYAKKAYKNRFAGKALQQYYKNVSGLSSDNILEIHFLKDTPYGYFWIFPLKDNHVNIGLGIPDGIIKKKKLNIKDILEGIINNNPQISPRFKNAEALSRIKGGKLNVSGYRNKKISAERILLTGDAANLVNPFSGEGVGNAIRSGRIAAKHIIKAFELNRFDAEFNKMYDREISKKILKESRVFLLIQVLFSRSKQKRFLIRMLKNKPYFFDWLIRSFIDYRKFYGLLNPVTIFRILFR